MEFPESVTKVAEEEAARHSDAPTAITEAEKRIRGLPEFDGLVNALVRNAVRELVYAARHAATVARKREAGLYGGPPKVTGWSEGINRIYEQQLKKTPKKTGRKPKGRKSG